MRVLLAIARYDYGHADAGDSYEYTAFFDPLVDLGHQVSVFDTFGAAWRGDPDATGRGLLQAVEDAEPDLMLSMVMEDELPLEAVRQASRWTTTVNWFVDDVWRFKAFSRHVAPAFSHVFTTSHDAERAYGDVAGVRAGFLPLGFNERVFRPVKARVRHEVSFVGQRHGRRSLLVEQLRREGFDVHARGVGWPDGRVSSDELAATISASDINLSFMEVSAGPLRRRGAKFRGVWKADALLGRVVRHRLQMKARLFEIAACGGFQLTGRLPREAVECFRPGAEVVAVRRDSDLAETIRYYLGHPEERLRIAAAGHLRARRDHSYQRRFESMFNQLGMSR